MKPIINLSAKRLNLIFIVTICILFYILNYFTPLYYDDWHYNFIFGTLEPINSLGDIIKSQYIHYNEFNGRFTPHFFIQLFDGILGKGLFNIVNTIFFLSFLYLIKIVTHCNKSLYYSFNITILILLLLLPGLKNNLLWMSGACNYLWVAVFILLFHILLTQDKYKKQYYPLIFLFGFFSGWTNEAITIGIAGAYFIYYASHRKELTPYKISLLSCFFIGCILLVLAPGSIHRALGNGLSSFDFDKFINKIIYSLKAMSNLRIFILLCFFLIISKITKRINIKHFISVNQIWFVAMSLSFIFVLLTGHDSPHSRFGIELFALILVLKLLSVYNIPTLSLYIINLFIYLLLFYVLYFAHINYVDYKKCINQMKNYNQEIILNNPIEYTPFLNRFIIQVPDPTSAFINNECIANHFAKKRILFIPEKLYYDIKSNKNSYNSFDLNSPYPFYVKKISKSQQVKSVIFKLNEYESRKKTLKRQNSSNQKNNDNSEYLQATTFSIIELNEENYLFVSKIKSIENRVINILVN